MSADVLLRRAVRGATALRGGASWRPSPYQVFGGLFWLVMSLAYWRVPQCCDAGQHAAVVERLRASLLSPRHPTADLPGAGSPYYSPYAVAEGAFARLTDLGGWAVLRLAGPLNLLVLLTGLARFVRVLAPRRIWAPVLALFATTLLWGTESAWWSGSLGLLPMTGNLGDPSMFAIGLTFWAWALTATRAAGGDGPVRYVGPSGLRGFPGYAGVGALYGLILLVHPVTGLAAALGAVAVVAGTQRRWRPAVAGRWALTGGAALLVAYCWPYFDLFAVIGHPGLDATYERLYEGMPGHFWLALAALPALWPRARGSVRDPLVLMFVLECALVAYGWVSGHHAYGGAVGLALVPAQIALAVELAAPRPWPVRRRVLGVVAAAAACAGFLTAQAGAVVPRSLDPVGFEQPPRAPTYAWAARYIEPGEAVVADGRDAVRLLPGHGVDLVAPTLPDPALDERERQRRLAAVRAYLAPTSTRAERTAVARRHHVRWLLLTPRQRMPEEAVAVAWSRETGEVLARVDAGAGTARSADSAGSARTTR
ncbi:hypothetical protein ACFVGN_13080 [Streptomyces sp. NPDC057757]|uniref:hypothetical protein n=1 Tax=Streptomyces sp. NPDC057757 TaxID=3346241 RepID=UPI003678382C